MTDSDLIDGLGGPAAVAELLGYAKLGGTQRVQNWKGRGIPASVKLERPDVFLPPYPVLEEVKKRRAAAPDPAPAAQQAA